MESMNETVEVLDAGASTARFLASVFFRELTDEAIAQLAAAEWPEDTGNASLDEGYRLVRRYFALTAANRREQLAVEYARVFLAAGVFSSETRSAVPYESVFTGEEHLMMGPARDDCVRRYAADGFQVDPDLHEPEDHVSFELEYVAHLCDRASAALAAGDEADAAAAARRAAAFIDEHLLAWLPALLSAVRDYAKTTFYPGMVLVAIGALEQLREQIDEAFAAA